MTDPLRTALREQTDVLVRQAALPSGVVILERARQRRRSRAVVSVAAVSVLAVAGAALFIPQLVGRDAVRLAPAPTGGAGSTEATMFGDELIVARGGSRDHLLGPIAYPDYPSRPPLVGAHAPAPQRCAVYAEAIAPEHAVHSLEHGATWVTYRPDLAPQQVEQLAGMVAGQPYRLMSPLPGQQSPIVLTAWSRQLPVDSADDPRVEAFLDYYSKGPQTPEVGAACDGVTATGTSPVDE